MDITKAIAVFLPLVRVLVLEAESAGGSGERKHQAVSGAAEALYRQLQGSVKELRGIDWDIIAPFVVAPATGVIAIVVGMLNTLWGKAWAFLSGLTD